MIFGKKIKELREEHGMVQRKLAASLNPISMRIWFGKAVYLTESLTERTISKN